MPSVYLIAATGQVVIKCRAITLTIPHDLGEPLALALHRAVAAACAGRFSLIVIPAGVPAGAGGLAVVSSPNRVALTDHTYRRVIFLTALGARQLARYCDLARVLNRQAAPSYVN